MGFDRVVQVGELRSSSTSCYMLLQAWRSSALLDVVGSWASLVCCVVSVADEGVFMDTEHFWTSPAAGVGLTAKRIVQHL